MGKEQTHDLMNACLGRIASVLEAAGVHPCTALKIANEAMEPAWSAWNAQAERISRLEVALELLEKNAVTLRDDNNLGVHRGGEQRWRS